MYRKLIAAAFVLGFAGTPASSQMGCCTNSTVGVISSTSCCVYTSSETKPLTPREKLKAERDSYQRQLDGYIKERDQYTKKIDETSAQLKGYDDAIEKLSK